MRSYHIINISKHKTHITSGLLLGVVIGALLPFPGCGNSATPEQVCEICQGTDVAVFQCFNVFDESQGAICLADNMTPPQVAYECKVEFGILTDAYGEFVPCDGTAWGTWGEEEDDDEGADESASSICAEWDPDEYVTNVSSGNYTVDAVFLADLVANATPLVECDGARFEPSLSGYKVVGATSGTLIYALGLRNNDIILEINDMPLENADDAAKALADLYFASQETEYSLEFLRGSFGLTYYYELD